MEKTFTQIIRTNRLSDGEILLNNKKELDEDKKKILNDIKLFILKG